MSGILGRVKEFIMGPDDSYDEFAEPEGEEEDSSPSLYESSSRRSYASGSTSGAGETEEDLADSAASRDRPWRTESRRRAAESTNPNPSIPSGTSGLEMLSRDRRTSSQQREQRSVGSNMGGNVIGLPNVNQVTNEVVVVEPRSFDEMAQVIQNLRDRKTVIMNLTLMDPGDAQRSVDFVAGGTYAIDGHQERIGENIFLFTPSTVSVSTPSTTPVQIPMQPMQTPTPIWSTSFSDSSQVIGR